MSMMQQQTKLTHKLNTVFERPQAVMLAEVITDAYNDLVKTSDFNELKSIVKELAQAQKELAEAQKETQIEIKKLAQGLRETNGHLGGLGRSVAYALENEAYRMLPELLEKRYGIEMSERLVRTTIEGEEINIFGRGRRQGQDILLVGETKLRLDERRQKKRGQKGVFAQLAAKAEAVASAYPDIEIVLLLITHFARPSVLKHAEEQGIIVVQSFEW